MILPAGAIIVYHADLVAAFAAWEKEYREDPEGFAAASVVSDWSIDTYGENATVTLVDYLAKTGAMEAIA